METQTTSQVSPTAGKGAEPTAHATPAAATPGKAEFQSQDRESVTSLLASEFARTEPEVEPATPAPGPEVPPAVTGADGTQPGTPPETPAPGTGAETPPESPDARTPELPAEVLEQVQAWETAGGALPPALQSIVDGRIKRELGKVKDLEARATTAEAEVQRLTTELDGNKGPRAETAGGTDEKSLDALAKASKAFQADARAFIGGYADEKQTQRIEKHMESTGMDEKGLRRQLDEVNDWLTNDLPQKRQAVQAFKAAEAEVSPIVKARFASLEKADGEEAKWAREIAQLIPELSQRTPAHKLAVGVYALGKVAWDHLSQASKDGDVIESLRGLLQRHVPLTKTGTNGTPKPGVLPGKAPVKTPTGSPLASTRTAPSRQAEQEEASRKIQENPTAENVTESLRMALR